MWHKDLNLIWVCSHMIDYEKTKENTRHLEGLESEISAVPMWMTGMKEPSGSLTEECAWIEGFKINARCLSYDE